MFGKLLYWFLGFRRKGKGGVYSRIRVTLYTRHHCHLCEVAHNSLLETQQSYPFALSIIDIDSDRELAERYGDQVPVVAVNGKVRFHGKVNRVLLQRLLHAEARRRPAAGEEK